MPKGLRFTGLQHRVKDRGVSSVLEWISQPSSPAKDTRTSWHQVPSTCAGLMRKPRLTQVRIGDGGERSRAISDRSRSGVEKSRGAVLTVISEPVRSQPFAVMPLRGRRGDQHEVILVVAITTFR
jgi:hypothetical protein